MFQVSVLIEYVEVPATVRKRTTACAGGEFWTQRLRAARPGRDFFLRRGVAPTAWLRSANRRWRGRDGPRGIVRASRFRRRGAIPRRQDFRGNNGGMRRQSG